MEKSWPAWVVDFENLAPLAAGSATSRFSSEERVHGLGSRDVNLGAITVLLISLALFPLCHDRFVTFATSKHSKCRVRKDGYDSEKQDWRDWSRVKPTDFEKGLYFLQLMSYISVAAPCFLV